MTDPFELCIDWDLLALIENILADQGPDSAQIGKVNGHADESMGRDGRMRMLDKIGDDLVDGAADFGRRVPPAIIDSERMVHSACTAWDSLILDLHRFFIAIPGEAVNRDGRGGTSIHPSVWSAGHVPERGRVLQAVREFAWVPGHPGLWDAGAVSWLDIVITPDDVPFWHFSVCSLVKICVFLRALHSLATVDDLGVGGVSHI